MPSDTESISTTISLNSVESKFLQLRTASRKALVGYLTLGHPDANLSIDCFRALEEGGADVIEAGVPFSDPIADGPVIQDSSQRALAAGMTFDGALRLIADAALSVPVVLFSYLNPILAAGVDALERAAAAGVSGILITDIPLGADPEREEWLSNGPLAFIRLVAPTTPALRMAEIARHGSGFVYLISRLGVTGAQKSSMDSLPATVRRLRSVTELPICAGFGISTPEDARAVASIADGVVVGSALVSAASRGADEVMSLTASLRSAIDG